MVARRCYLDHVVDDGQPGGQLPGIGLPEMQLLQLCHLVNAMDGSHVQRHFLDRQALLQPQDVCPCRKPKAPAQLTTSWHHPIPVDTGSLPSIGLPCAPSETRACTHWALSAEAPWLKQWRTSARVAGRPSREFRACRTLLKPACILGSDCHGNSVYDVLLLCKSSVEQVSGLHP